ncbi:MAG: type II restriction endonuclease subunit R, partial [Bacteroidaceae bacterium]|nr:type II restriction endonuclease subunit R [Bacteroidaceae bacterium]
KNKNWIDLYKVIFSKATCEHAGTPDRNGKYRVFSTMKILKPNEICTQSYLVGGVFENVEEATNYLTYLKTKFVRGLILPTLTSQDLSADKFMFVPLQDFTKPWTDEELYAKYHLGNEEIQFIESMIKPME